MNKEFFANVLIISGVACIVVSVVLQYLRNRNTMNLDQCAAKLSTYREKLGIYCTEQTANSGWINAIMSAKRYVDCGKVLTQIENGTIDIKQTNLFIRKVEAYIDLVGIKY